MTVVTVALLLWFLPTLIFLAVTLVALPGLLARRRFRRRAAAPAPQRPDVDHAVPVR